MDDSDPLEQIARILSRRNISVTTQPTLSAPVQAHHQPNSGEQAGLAAAGGSSNVGHDAHRALPLSEGVMLDDRDCDRLPQSDNAASAAVPAAAVHDAYDAAGASTSYSGLSEIDASAQSPAGDDTPPLDSHRSAEQQHQRPTPQPMLLPSSSSVLLIVDVHIGGQLVGHLPVRRHEAPYALAQRFSARHGLPVDAIGRLAKLVQSRLDDYLAEEAQGVAAQKRARQQALKREQEERLQRAIAVRASRSAERDNDGSGSNRLANGGTAVQPFPRQQAREETRQQARGAATAESAGGAAGPRDAGPPAPHNSVSPSGRRKEHERVVLGPAGRGSALLEVSLKHRPSYYSQDSASGLAQDEPFSALQLLTARTGSPSKRRTVLAPSPPAVPAAASATPPRPHSPAVPFVSPVSRHFAAGQLQQQGLGLAGGAEYYGGGEEGGPRSRRYVVASRGGSKWGGGASVEQGAMGTSAGTEGGQWRHSSSSGEGSAEGGAGFLAAGSDAAHDNSHSSNSSVMEGSLSHPVALEEIWGRTGRQGHSLQQRRQAEDLESRATGQPSSSNSGDGFSSLPAALSAAIEPAAAGVAASSPATKRAATTRGRNEPTPIAPFAGPPSTALPELAGSSGGAIRAPQPSALPVARFSPPPSAAPPRLHSVSRSPQQQNYPRGNGAAPSPLFSAAQHAGGSRDQAAGTRTSSSLNLPEPQKHWHHPTPAAPYHPPPASDEPRSGGSSIAAQRSHALPPRALPGTRPTPSSSGPSSSGGPAGSPAAAHSAAAAAAAAASAAAAARALSAFNFSGNNKAAEVRPPSTGTPASAPLLTHNLVAFAAAAPPPLPLLSGVGARSAAGGGVAVDRGGGDPFRGQAMRPVPPASLPAPLNSRGNDFDAPSHYPTPAPLPPTQPPVPDPQDRGPLVARLHVDLSGSPSGQAQEAGPPRRAVLSVHAHDHPAAVVGLFAAEHGVDPGDRSMEYLRQLVGEQVARARAQRQQAPAVPVHPPPGSGEIPTSFMQPQQQQQQPVSRPRRPSTHRAPAAAPAAPVEGVRRSVNPYHLGSQQQQGGDNADTSGGSSISGREDGEGRGDGGAADNWLTAKQRQLLRRTLSGEFVSPNAISHQAVGAAAASPPAAHPQHQSAVTTSAPRMPRNSLLAITPPHPLASTAIGTARPASGLRASPNTPGGGTPLLASSLSQHASGEGGDMARSGSRDRTSVHGHTHTSGPLDKSSDIHGSSDGLSPHATLDQQYQPSVEAGGGAHRSSPYRMPAPKQRLETSPLHPYVTLAQLAEQEVEGLDEADPYTAPPRGTSRGGVRLTSPAAGHASPSHSKAPRDESGASPPVTTLTQLRSRAAAEGKVLPPPPPPPMLPRASRSHRRIRGSSAASAASSSLVDGAAAIAPGSSRVRTGSAVPVGQNGGAGRHVGHLPPSRRGNDGVREPSPSRNAQMMRSASIDSVGTHDSYSTCGSVVGPLEAVHPAAPVHHARGGGSSGTQSATAHQAAPPARSKPLFNLEVDVGGGRIETLVVCIGDEPEATAAAFCRARGLSQHLIPQLLPLLQAGLRAHG